MQFSFTSDRLGFRNWVDHDHEVMSKINADDQVMEHFLSTQTKEETKAFIERNQNSFDRNGF